MRYALYLMMTTFLVLTPLASTTLATDWPQWRGPFFNGSTDEKNLPTRWTPTENIAWSVDLPGPGAATPIIWKNRVFISSTDEANETLLAMCFDRTTGKPLWRNLVGKGLRKDRRSYFAAPSPLTDGNIVIFFYSNGMLIGYDLEGKRLWSRNIQDDFGTFAFLWTFSSSPMLWEGTLYLQVLQRDVPVQGRGLPGQENKSYLLAMNPQTGKTLWRHFRPSKAVRESREAYSTPIPALLDGKQQILIVGGDALTGHDPKTGLEFWRWGTWNPRRITHWRHVPSPVVGEGVVLACAPKNDPVYAIRPRGTGIYDDSAIAWTSRDVREVTSDVPTPAFYKGDFFVLSGLRKCLSRVEPQTGRVKWMTNSLGSVKYEASPLAADDKLYLINHQGEVTVVNAADGKVLNTISMDDPSRGRVVRASISAAYGYLFIRTTSRLFCVGKKME